MILNWTLLAGFVTSLMVFGPAAADVSGQVKEGDTPRPATTLLLVKIRVFAKIKERLERPLIKEDFEASTYEKSFTVESVREMERGPMGERHFIIGIPVETRLMIPSWISDRMIVSIRYTQKTWGLLTRVVERRIADQ